MGLRCEMADDASDPSPFLRADPFDAELPVVGVEFLASSISSSFFDGAAAVAGLVDAALSANPQLRFFDTLRPSVIVSLPASSA